MKLTRELAEKLCELSLKPEFKVFIEKDSVRYLELASESLIVNIGEEDFHFYLDTELDIDIYQLTNILEA